MKTLYRPRELFVVMAQKAYYESILDFIESTSDRNQRYCVNLARQILSRTGHVPVAYNVARGAAFCSYFARMVESIGVKESVPFRISGKGKDIHRILGIASFYLFEDGVLPPQHHRIEECIETSISELKDLSLITNQQDWIDIAKSMLANLVNNIPRMLQVLDSNHEPFDAVVEQQLVDYEVHIRGVPDLILENKEQRKAIVIEWKSSPNTPFDWEEAQVLVYSLLAARRLGFERKQAVEAILGKIDKATDTFTDLHILPVIIRPTTTATAVIKPHPALSGLSGPDLHKQYEEFKKLLANILIEAEHLTLLSFNIERFSPDEAKEAREKCVATTMDGHKVYSLRYTPHQLPRGRPMYQDKYPCTACIDSIRDACKFYYGRGFGNIDEFDKTMWGLRFKVYEKLESLLMPYRAVYDIFKQREKDIILEWIKEGHKIIWNEQYPRFVYEGPPIIEIEVSRNRRLLSQKIKVDCVDNIEDENPIAKTLTLSRPLRQFEKDGLPAVLHEDKTGMLILLDNDQPLLAPNLFCRVEEVKIDDNSVRYVVGIPSAVFDYQFVLFRRYLNLNKERRHDIFLIEMGVNLLQLELKAIDLLQRTMTESKDNEEDIKNPEILKEEINGLKQDFERNYYGEASSFVENIRQIIKQGHPSSRNKMRKTDG